VVRSQLPPPLAEDRGGAAGEPLPLPPLARRAILAAAHGAVGAHLEASISQKGAKTRFSLCLDFLLPAQCPVLLSLPVVE